MNSDLGFKFVEDILKTISGYPGLEQIEIVGLLESVKTSILMESWGDFQKEMFKKN